jgi:hypothetical protein
MNAIGQAVKPLGEDTTKPDLDSLFKEFSCSAEGLSGAEPNKRLEKDGLNARHRGFLEFIKQPLHSHKL